MGRDNLICYRLTFYFMPTTSEANHCTWHHALLH